MRPPEPPAILDCGHVEVKDNHCATTDCPHFIDRPGFHISWDYRDPPQHAR